jgi:hypothetical protein
MHVTTELTISSAKSYLKTDGLSANLSWYQVTIWYPRAFFFFYFHGKYFQTIPVFFFVGRPPWREDGSVIYPYNFYWALPELSLLGSSPTEPETVSYCLI